MHRIYTTDGYILGGKNIGEANRYYFILTRDLGLVVASAQGVRKIVSKLRPSLQDYSCSKISFVRGKHGWKITNAAKYFSLFTEFKENKPVLVIITHIFTFIRRLVGEETEEKRIFEIIDSTMLFLKSVSGLNKNFVSVVESIVMFQILHVLGYVGDEKNLLHFVDFEWSLSHVENSLSHDTALRSAINNSLKATHL